MIWPFTVKASQPFGLAYQTWRPWQESRSLLLQVQAADQQQRHEGIYYEYRNLGPNLRSTESETVF